MVTDKDAKEPSSAAAADAKSSESSSAAAATTTAANVTTPNQKKMVPRKELPSIAHMLVHGAPESQGKPKTWMEVVGFPLILLLLFIISFYIFLNSPPSRHPRGRYSLPQMQRGGGNMNQLPVKTLIKDVLSSQKQQDKTEDSTKEEF